MSRQIITPFLWFDRQVKAAAGFDVSLGPDTKIVQIISHDNSGPGPPTEKMI